MSDTIQRGGGRPSGYFQVDGKRVPSVTTITSRFKESGGLVKAANRVGLEGKTLEEAWYGPALSIGDQVHKMVEATLNGEQPEQPTSIEAIGAYDAWLEWWQGANYSVLATELPLVSEVHRFGGTIDSVLVSPKGELGIGDWKTSNGIYAEMLLQVCGGYPILWNEHNEATIDFCLIARFSKEHGDLEVRQFRNVADIQETFLLMRDLYDRIKGVEKRAR